MPSRRRIAVDRRHAWGREPIILRLEPREGWQFRAFARPTGPDRLATFLDVRSGPAGDAAWSSSRMVALGGSTLGAIETTAGPGDGLTTPIPWASIPAEADLIVETVALPIPAIYRADALSASASGPSIPVAIAAPTAGSGRAETQAPLLVGRPADDPTRPGTGQGRIVARLDPSNAVTEGDVVSLTARATSPTWNLVGIDGATTPIATANLDPVATIIDPARHPASIAVRPALAGRVRCLGLPSGLAPSPVSPLASPGRSRPISPRLQQERPLLRIFPKLAVPV